VGSSPTDVSATFVGGMASNGDPDAMTGCLRLIVFDFDQTLSSAHVFKALSGWGGGAPSKGGFVVPKPFASSEEGQVRRIDELNQTKYLKTGGFAIEAFGGEKRVKEVRDQLQALKERNVEMVICTKGLVGAVRKCLEDLDLQHYFTEVYGNVGDNYGSSPYDNDVAKMPEREDLRRLLGSSTQSNWQSKAKLIARLMQKDRLSNHQVVLVEDDPEEIRKASRVCQTLFVKEAKGMTLEHFKALHAMHDGKPMPVQAHASRPKGAWCSVQ